MRGKYAAPMKSSSAFTILHMTSPSLPGQHNDARMNLAIAMTAAREGATIANHVEVLSLIKEGGVVRGAHVRDTLTNKEWDVLARVVVNATGELV